MSLRLQFGLRSDDITIDNGGKCGYRWTMISADEALERLREGNLRFIAERRTEGSVTSKALRTSLVDGQNPCAVILGCSDSRVPVEMVFDQNLGDLFVIRVAGNIVAPSQIGSVEFAAEKFGTRLVVVMGHSFCGAVQATVEAVRNTEEMTSPNLRSIVDRIRPAIVELVEDRDDMDEDMLLRRAVRANVRASVDHLRHGSRILEQLIEEDGLRVVGAKYSLKTGAVEFFDGA
jgi:carbonic anhydrase